LITALINFIGRQAKVLAALLTLVVIANVGWQFYSHKTTTLTPWKGGGFGMYTAPHPDTRSVWLEMDGVTDRAQMRIYPRNRDLHDWIDGVSLRGGAVLRDISLKGASMRYFPRDDTAKALISQAARIGWLDSFTGGVAPKSGKTFAPQDMRIVVYETVYDAHAKTVTRKAIYRSDLGGQ